MEIAIEQQVREHDLDYERLLNGINRTNRGTLWQLCTGEKPIASRVEPASTIYSSLNRMLKSGPLVKENGFATEAPFFSRWLKEYLR